MSTNDGGAAFPMSSGDEPREGKTTHYNEGMSLRAHMACEFAAAMLAGCVGKVGNAQEITAYAKGHCNSAVIDRAITMADALIAALSTP